MQILLTVPSAENVVQAQSIAKLFKVDLEVVTHNDLTNMDLSDRFVWAVEPTTQIMNRQKAEKFSLVADNSTYMGNPEIARYAGLVLRIANGKSPTSPTQESWGGTFPYKSTKLWSDKAGISSQFEGFKGAATSAQWRLEIEAEIARLSAVPVTKGNPWIGVAAPRLVDAGSPYNAKRVQFADALDDIGIHRIRCTAVLSGTGRDTIRYLANRGFQFLFTLPRVTSSLQGHVDFAAALEAQFPGSFMGFEGPNEVNSNPITHAGITDKGGEIPSGVPLAKAREAVLFYMKVARGRMDRTPGLETSKGKVLYNFTDYTITNNESCTHLNAHAYYKAPASWFRGLVARQWIIDSGKPIGLTEFGGPLDVTPENKLEAFRQWAEVLTEDRPNPTTSFAFSGMGTREYSYDGSFGIINYDGSLTPAAEALKAAIATAKAR